MARSSSNRNSASARASSVFPTPVGPRKTNEPIGLLGSESPARVRRIAFATASTASCWSTTRWCTSSSIRTSFCISPSMRRETGMPVHVETTSATSSSSTSSFSILRSRWISASFAFSSSMELASSTSLPYRSSAARSRSPSRSARSASVLAASMSEPIFRIRSMWSFSRCQWAFMAAERSWRSASSLSRRASRSFDASSLSFRRAARSISSCFIRRSTSSISVGMESISIQGRVLLHMLAVLVERGRADCSELATGEHRLQHVAGVDRTLRRTGADDRVQLVDERDDLALALGDLPQRRLEPLLELPAVLRARDQRPDVQGDHALVLQRFGDVSGHDPLSQPLDDGGLAHAGLADQHRVVLRPSREHLHHPAHLIVPADDGVELPTPREVGEIAPVPLERLKLLLRVLVGHPLPAAHFRKGRQDRVALQARLAEQPAGTCVLIQEG